MSSSPVVLRQSYGKSQVRVSRIRRHGGRQEFIDVTVRIELGGDFASAYTEGSNSLVVPTDTMKNTVYVLARRDGIDSIEAFAQLLGRHFLATYAHVDRVDVACEEKVWSRLEIDGKLHDHAFVGGSSERNTCSVTATRPAIAMLSGLTGLQVLKTTASGFAGFPRDRYTTLPETDDRIFATSVTASWPCRELGADWTAARQAIRGALVDVFANQYSKSVQHTLYEMARAAFAVYPSIDEISIGMPNQHHLPANLAPFGLENPGEVFVPTSEPFGNISATIARSAVEKKS